MKHYQPHTLVYRRKLTSSDAVKGIIHLLSEKRKDPTGIAQGKKKSDNYTTTFKGEGNKEGERRQE